MPADPLPSAAPQPALPRLFVLGDSISIHYGPYLEQMLAGRYVCDRKGSELLAAAAYRGGDAQPGAPLQRLAALDPGLTEINAGDSACVLDYLRRRPPACDTLLLNCGLHDLKADPHTRTHQVEPGEYARNLAEILALAQRAARRVVWVRTTPVADENHNRLSVEFKRYNADVITYNAIADELVRRAGIASIDLYGFTFSLCDAAHDLETLLIDHVHFGDPARRLQAAYIAGWLEAQG